MHSIGLTSGVWSQKKEKKKRAGRLGQPFNQTSAAGHSGGKY